MQGPEEYLVHVASSCRSMCLAKLTLDELRVRTSKRTRLVLELEPTYHSIIGGYIKRWLFLYKVCTVQCAVIF